MMSENTPTRGGFVVDPAVALAVTGSGACCGSPAQAVVAGRHPAQGNRWRDVIFIERRSPRIN